MFSSFGQFAATSQFYLFGKSHCTRTGWEKAIKKYAKPDILQDPSLNLQEKVFLITGASAGIGKEISTFLAAKNASVYMICRNLDKGNQVKNNIIEQTKNPKVYVLQADCGLEADIRRVWEEFQQHQQNNNSNQELRLDALICNAGALLNERTLTSEGVEVTFATHLLFGTYLLGSLAFSLLNKTPDSRLIAVSSGGMYNTKFPEFPIATATNPEVKYDGQFAYAYAKRGQVLLCEQWAKEYPNVKVVSCHPGWTLTEGVEAAYGENKKYLEPLRTLWQGAEGIAWLALTSSKNIETGAFYLDRSPQVKHMAGPFFSEGSHTKNTPEETQQMMNQLFQWANGKRPTEQEIHKRIARTKLMKATDKAIDISKFMGRWYVLAAIPTSIEIGAKDCIENYEYDDNTQSIKVKFDYTPKNQQVSTYATMLGKVKNSPINTYWSIIPKFYGLQLPINLDYLILETEEDYSITLVGVPDRNYVWIMIRDKPLITNEEPQTTFSFYQLTHNILTNQIVSIENYTIPTNFNSEQYEKERQMIVKYMNIALDLGYTNLDKMVRVPWTLS